MRRAEIMARWEFAQRWMMELAKEYGPASAECREWEAGEYAAAFEARRAIK